MAVINKVGRLKLGAFTDNADDYITFNSLLKIIGIDASYTKKIEKFNFPISTKTVRNKKVRIVYIDQFLKWLEKDNNKHLVDFSNLEVGEIFAIEPEWFDKIKNGEKTHEYREYKTYWRNRLEKSIGDDFSAIRLRHGNIIVIEYPHFINFVCGYAKKEDKTKRLKARLLTIRLVDGRETDLKINKPVYDIEFELIKDGE